MIDYVFGKKSNPQAIEQLVGCIDKLDLDGTLYVGYPIFDVDDDSLLTDALLVTKEYGVVAFDLTTEVGAVEDDVINYQDDIYRGLFKKFLTEKSLVKRRKLSFDIEIFTFRQLVENYEEIEVITPGDFNEKLSSCDTINESEFKLINAAIQKTAVLKPQKKRNKAITDGSFGTIIKKIEKEIANLDKWQKKAAIESPEKPQRIRGLAGCGKTIILAMKAAYLHAYNPELKIAVTFQSRALYQQFTKLIEKFYFQHKTDEPDTDFLQIRHAWGSSREVGIYSEICNQLGIEPLSFMAAQSKYGQEKAFEGACQEALDFAEKVEVEPLFDYLLIDEAQDFPTSFFKLIYKFANPKKQIVWAYDELQNLGDFTMLPPEELFGGSELQAPLVTLVNEDNKPQQDIMLPICYRNPPWTLSLALALGLGIYREQGLVRMFNEPTFWKHIGYEVIGGQLERGQPVRLQRSLDRTPSYFSELLKPEDAIKCRSFDNMQQEAEWVAKDIQNSITENELEPSDILIVFPKPYTLASDSAYLMNELRKLQIDCHIVGKNTSRDVVFVEGSIAITHIYRAKGNESPLVYVMGANYSNSGMELGKKRNSLFTAITRAKAWVRITGVGDEMNSLMKEINAVFEKEFQLQFSYPTTAQLSELSTAYQDKTDDEKQEIYEGFSQIKKLKAMYDSGELSKSDIPPEMWSFFE